MTASSKTTRANGQRRPLRATASTVAQPGSQLVNLGTMIGPRGTDWDHTHREETALAREICVDDRVFGDPPDWSPACLADWLEPGVGRVATDCRLVDTAFWLGMHFQRLHGAPPEVARSAS